MKNNHFDKKGVFPGSGLLVGVFAIVGIVAVVWFLAGAMGDKGSGLSVAPASAVSSGNNAAADKLTFTEDVTITISATDVYDSSVGIGGTHQYQICDVNGEEICSTLKTVSNGGTDTASPGNVVKVLFGFGNATGTSIYLNDYKTFIIKDQGTQQLKSSLYRNGTVTSRIFNEEGNLIDDVSENETIAAGDTPSLSFDLQGQFERGQFAYGGCMMVDYNTTGYDDVVVVFDKGTSKIGTPTYFTSRASGFQVKTYSIPPFKSNEKAAGTITIDADNTNDPTDDGTAAYPGAGGDILIEYIPNEWRQNPDTDEFELFVCGEDQDGNRVANAISSVRDTIQVD